MPGRLYVWALILMLVTSSAGCIFIPLGVAGHVIHQGNQEYDDIIVNMGYEYKLYYKDCVAKNDQLAMSGKTGERVPSFCEWVRTRANTVKERKAVERYVRINGCAITVAQVH